MSTASRFFAAHAAGPWGRAVKSCRDQLGDLPAGAALGFVYVSDALGKDFASIVTFLRETTGIEDWVGTVGIGVCGTGAEYFDEPAVSVMVASLPRESYRVFPTVKADLADFRRDHGAWLERALPPFGIVHGDPRNPRTPKLVAELADSVSTFLVGGITSSRNRFDQVAGGVLDGGISGVLFSHEVPVATALSQGCTPIGPVHTVTAGFDSVVVTLDGRSAYEVLADDAGGALPGGADPARGIEVALPVRGSDTGDYVVRSLIGADSERGFLVIGENVAAGDRVMFVHRGHESAAADMTRMLDDLHSRIPHPPKAGVYVACVARGPGAFAETMYETDMIRRRLGDFPLVGFFSNGEISHNRLYGYTGVLALFL